MGTQLQICTINKSERALLHIKIHDSLLDFRKQDQLAGTEGHLDERVRVELGQLGRLREGRDEERCAFGSLASIDHFLHLKATSIFGKNRFEDGIVRSSRVFVLLFTLASELPKFVRPLDVLALKIRALVNEGWPESFQHHNGTDRISRIQKVQNRHNLILDNNVQIAVAIL